MGDRIFRLRAGLLAAALAASSLSSAALGAEPADPLGSLRGVQPPAAAYNALVADKRWLLALGKALF